MEPKITTFESNGWTNIGLAVILPKKIIYHSAGHKNN